MIRIESVSVRYGPVLAVDDVSLEVPTGTLCGVLGPNGAGKSSLIEAISGRVQSSGRIYGPDGLLLSSLSTEERVRAGLAFVPQGRELFGELTVRQNLELGGLQISKEQTRDRIAEVLETFPLLENITKRRAGVLSGGEQQSLTIARALISSPATLILDEPSFGLSPSLRQLIFETIVEQQEQTGITVLLTEQFADLVLEHADQVVVMSHGRIEWAGQPEDLKPGVLESAYLGTDVPEDG